MRVNRILVATLFALLSAEPALATTPAPSDDDPQAPASRQDRLTSAESYMPMPTLAACILRRYSTSGTIVLDMGIDIPNAALRHHALANAPRLRDALRTALSAYANLYYHEHTPPDPDTLTRLLQRAVDQTLGAAGGQVLLVNIVYQRRQSNHSSN